jgi:hypothetical protein
VITKSSKVAAVVGVPLMMPVDSSITRPGGRFDAVNRNGSVPPVNSSFTSNM